MKLVRARAYVPPVLLKRRRLTDVVAGIPQRVSDGGSVTPKGGCFEAPQSGEPATPQTRDGKER